VHGDGGRKGELEHGGEENKSGGWENMNEGRAKIEKATGRKKRRGEETMSSIPNWAEDQG
jgi:hypothetical protein